MLVRIKPNEHNTPIIDAIEKYGDIWWIPTPDECVLYNILPLSDNDRHFLVVRPENTLCCYIVTKDEIDEIL